jgi:hypothetical protein
MWRAAPCSVPCDVPTAIRFVNNAVHYVFWAPHFGGAFPYVGLQKHVLDPAISFAGGAEEILGIVPLDPLVLLGTFLALALALRRTRNEPGVRAALFVMSAAWTIVAGLSTCRWVTARYSLDFMLLMTAASAVCIEEALGMLAAHVRTRTAAAALAAVAVYSIVTGLLLGLTKHS